MTELINIDDLFDNCFMCSKCCKICDIFYFDIEDSKILSCIMCKKIIKGTKKFMFLINDSDDTYIRFKATDGNLGNKIFCKLSNYSNIIIANSTSLTSNIKIAFKIIDFYSNNYKNFNVNFKTLNKNKDLALIFISDTKCLLFIEHDINDNIKMYEYANYDILI